MFHGGGLGCFDLRVWDCDCNRIVESSENPTLLWVGCDIFAFRERIHCIIPTSVVTAGVP